jgi:hypothetical protein
MSLIFMEGFEAHATNGNVIAPNGKFTVVGSNVLATAGRLGGLAGCFSGSATGQLIYFPLPRLTSFVLGMGFRMDSLSASARGFAFYENSNEGIGFGVNSNGALTINRGSTNLYTGSAGDIVAGTWYYIELSCSTIAATGATIVLRKDTSVQTTLTNQNSRPSTNLWVDNFRINGQGTNTYLPSFDDMYILDTTGSVNNAFLGKRKVILLQPVSDSGSQQWTTNSGSDHYNRVTDIPADGDTTYIEDGTSGHTDLFEVTDPELLTIDGVAVNAVCKQTDAGVLQLNLQCVSGGTTSNGSALPAPSASYLTKTRLLEQDPNTSAAWDNLNLMHAKFGIKVS